MAPPIRIIPQEDARRIAARHVDEHTPALRLFVQDGNVSAESIAEAKQVYLKPLSSEEERHVQDLLAYLGARHLVSAAKVIKAIEDQRRRR